MTELPPDPVPSVTAAHDQLGQHLASLAPTLWQFREALEEHGFDDYEAFTLTRDYFAHWNELGHDDDD